MCVCTRLRPVRADGRKARDREGHKDGKKKNFENVEAGKSFLINEGRMECRLCHNDDIKLWSSRLTSNDFFPTSHDRQALRLLAPSRGRYFPEGQE